MPDNRKLTRKADLVAGIKEQLQGQNLKQVWKQLDDLQKAAVAEVIHGQDIAIMPMYLGRNTEKNLTGEQANPMDTTENHRYYAYLSMALRYPTNSQKNC